MCYRGLHLTKWSSAAQYIPSVTKVLSIYTHKMKTLSPTLLISQGCKLLIPASVKKNMWSLDSAQELSDIPQMVTKIALSQIMCRISNSKWLYFPKNNPHVLKKKINMMWLQSCGQPHCTKHDIHTLWSNELGYQMLATLWCQLQKPHHMPHRDINKQILVSEISNIPSKNYVTFLKSPSNNLLIYWTQKGNQGICW